MNIDSYKSFVQYFGQRRSRKDKKNFIDNLEHFFSAYDIPMTKYEEKLVFHKSEHVVFGDLKRARKVYCVGYDTAEQMVIGNGQYFPLEENKNRANTFWNLLLTLLISLMIALIGIYFFYKGSGQQGFSKILYIICGVIIIMIANRFSRGLPNEATCSKTTSIFLLLEMVKEHHSSEDAAYAFLDDGAYSKIGINFIKKNDLFTDQQLKVYLDFFGDGDTVLIAHDKLAKKSAQTMLKKYPGRSATSSLENVGPNRFEEINNIIVISNVFSDENGHYYVDHVRKETDLTTDIETFDSVLNLLGEGNTNNENTQ